MQIDESLRRELSFEQELLLERQGDTINDIAAIEQHQTRIFQLRARIENLNNSLEREFPGYYDLLYNQQVLNPEMLQKKLSSREILLEYFYTEKHIYRFSISGESMQCQKIDHGQAFNRELAIIENYLLKNSLLDTIEIGHDLSWKPPIPFMQNTHP